MHDKNTLRIHLFLQINQYFLKSEKNLAGHPGDHGQEGFLPVDDARYTTPMAQVFIRHVKSLSLFTDNSINQSLPLITKMSKELSFFQQTQIV